jgi:hypothetical protein
VSVQPQRDAIGEGDLGGPGRSEQRTERQRVPARGAGSVLCAPATESGIAEAALSAEGNGGQPALVEVIEELLNLDSREPSPFRRPDARRAEFGVHPATVPPPRSLRQRCYR